MKRDKLQAAKQVEGRLLEAERKAETIGRVVAEASKAPLLIMAGNVKVAIPEDMKDQVLATVQARFDLDLTQVNAELEAL